MYNRTDIDNLAKETNYIRDNVEKIVRLSGILRQLNADSLFADNLALKGGTAINLVIAPLPRLSVDIDLDFTDNCVRMAMMRKRKEINERLDAYMNSEGYRLTPRSKSPLSIDSWVYQYTNSVGNNDNIKIEINYSMRCHILPIVRKSILIPQLGDFTVRTLDVVELYATKIKALLERGAARDLYDVHNMIEQNIIEEQQKPTLRKGIIFYSVLGSDTKRENLFSLDSISRLQFKQIRASLLPVLKKGTYFELESIKNQVVSYLKELLTITDTEEKFIRLFYEGLYKPELLFDDKSITDSVANHPMAIWKTQHIK